MLSPWCWVKPNQFIHHERLFYFIWYCRDSQLYCIMKCAIHFLYLESDVNLKNYWNTVVVWALYSSRANGCAVVLSRATGCVERLIDCHFGWTTATRAFSSDPLMLQSWHLLYYLVLLLQHRHMNPRKLFLNQASYSLFSSITIELECDEAHAENRAI